MKDKKRAVLKKHLKKGKIPDSKFNRGNLKKGMKVEEEHSKNVVVKKEIAKAHLKEDPKYYQKLEKMEKGKCDKKDEKEDEEDED